MKYGLCSSVMDNISKAVVGKKEAIELVIVALLAEGHVLLEDVPGQGKTLLSKALAKSIDGVYKRIQFTPDLLPSDITGFNIYNQKSGAFTYQPGPVMSNILLADEINRTIPRTQSSLLESMEERQITVDGQTMELPSPFFVIATQNPIEQEGTFPLPEAQLDRFLLKINLGYPDKEEEIEIMNRFQQDDPLQHISAVISPRELVLLQQERQSIRVSEPVKEYIADITGATRNSSYLKYGASPRGALGLLRAGQALAALRGRDFVLPDDIKALAAPVICHRLILKDEQRIKGMTAMDVLGGILDEVPVSVNI